MVHIIITLDIDGDFADARHAVSKALDDGELQDYGTLPGIDWKREPIAEIQHKLLQRVAKALTPAPERKTPASSQSDEHPSP